MSKILKFVGEKAMDGAKAVNSALSDKVNASLEESKRKKEVYMKAYKAEEERLLVEKALKDARKKVRR